MHETDNVASLLERTYAFQLVLFYEIIGDILAGKPLPQSAEQWTRQPFSRKAFNALQVISPDMDAAEIARRVRATSYGQFQRGAARRLSLRAKSKKIDASLATVVISS